MTTFLAYVDDAAHALATLPAVAALHANDTWVLVACAPRMTHRISKWVSNSTREQWRDKWTNRLFDALVPHFQTHGCRVYTEIAKGPLAELTQELLRVGPAEVVDLRRPKECNSDSNKLNEYRDQMPV